MLRYSYNIVLLQHESNLNHFFNSGENIPMEQSNLYILMESRKHGTPTDEFVLKIRTVILLWTHINDQK